MIDPIDKDNFLSVNNTWAYIDTKSPSLEELTRNIPAVKEDTIMKKGFAKGNDRYKGKSFDVIKVWMGLIYGGYNAH